MSDNSILLFFECLKSGLWGAASQSIEPIPDEVWNKICKLAEEQTVEAIVLDGLNISDAHIPQYLVLPLIAKTIQIENRNQLMNSFARELASLFRDKGIKALMVKGQGVGLLYRIPSHRQCGDIDLFLSKDNYNRALKVLHEKGAKNVLNDGEHVSMYFDEIEIELHSSLLRTHFMPVSKRMHKWFIEKANIDNDICCGLSTPNPLFNIVFIFYHFLHHFIVEGCGLRQLCDWMMCLHHANGQIDEQELFSLLKSFHLLKSWQLFGSVIVQYLGINEKEVPLYREWGREDLDKVMSVILEDGNFGHYSPYRHFSNNYLLSKWNSVKYRIGRLLKLYTIIPEHVILNLPNPFESIMRIFGDLKRRISDCNNEI